MNKTTSTTRRTTVIRARCLARTAVGILAAYSVFIYDVSAQDSQSGAAGTVVMEDDFSSASANWMTGKSADGRTWIEDGAMHVQAVEAPGSVVVLYDATYGDVVVDVEVTLADGTDDNWQTVMCRSVDDDNYYDLGISADGYFLLDIWVNGTKLNKSLGPSRSNHIRMGHDVVNNLRVECVGEDLRLFVNGNLVAELTDGNISRGRIGLSADAFASPYSEILFDNIRVTVP